MSLLEAINNNLNKSKEIKNKIVEYLKTQNSDTQILTNLLLEYTESTSYTIINLINRQTKITNDAVDVIFENLQKIMDLQTYYISKNELADQLTHLVKVWEDQKKLTEEVSKFYIS